MVNYLAVLVAAAAAMVIGGLWYSPIGFGKLWMKLSSLTPKQLEEAKKKNMTKSYVLTFISLLVMSYILALFINSTGHLGGLVTAFLIWLGFIAMVGVGSVLWDNKPWSLYALNMAYWLVALLVMGVILGPGFSLIVFSRVLF